MRTWGSSHRSVSRREALVGAFALAAGAFARESRAAQPRFATSVTGRVFEDLAGTGLGVDAAGRTHARRGAGVAGVMVSNGRDVVLTDDEGLYRLDVEPGEHVFVIKPPDWSLPLASGCTPHFFFPHAPHVDGHSPASLDFALTRTPEAAQFDALLFADVQPANAVELGYFDALLQANVGAMRGAEFALNHGDVMGDDLSLFPAYRRVIEKTGVPWHHCPGNHDMDPGSEEPQHAFDTWKREMGPTHFAFRHAGATFILLNNVDYAGSGRSFFGGRAYRGFIGRRQLSFVENVLKHVPRDDLVVLSMHIPLVGFEDPDNLSDTTGDRAQLMRLLAGRPNTVSFAGHSHTTEHHYLGADEGFAGARPHHHHVLTAASGSWWSGAVDRDAIPLSDSRDGTPKGFHVLSVDGSRYATRFVPFVAQASPQMRVMVSGAASSLTLVADVFDGGPETRVDYEIEGIGSAPVAMARTRAVDPYIAEVFARDRHLSKPWVKPAVSSHIWTAPLAGILPGGRHRFIVRVRLDSGVEHAAALEVDIMA